MAKPVSQYIKDILGKFDLDPKDALWDCHGTWVMYHRYVEIVGAKVGVTLDEPKVMYHAPDKGQLVIYVRGVQGERVEWSFGEVSPANNKNSYPWAMAEKRAKDRVILKLAGLAGHVYSEEESDDFTPARASDAGKARNEPKAEKEIPAHVQWANGLIDRVSQIADLDALDQEWKANVDHLKATRAIDADLAKKVADAFGERKRALIN
jgi:hypothetical protein